MTARACLAFLYARELDVSKAERPWGGGQKEDPKPPTALVSAGSVSAEAASPLSPVPSGCLRREGVHSVGELLARSGADLMDIRKFGVKSIDEVNAKLAGMGPALKDSPPRFDFLGQCKVDASGVMRRPFPVCETLARASRIFRGWPECITRRA